MPGAVPLLACGGDDSKLHLFIPSDDDGKVVMVAIVMMSMMMF